MSKRYRLMLLAAGLTALFAPTILPFLLAKPIRITEGSCARIQPGMTQRQVELILGAPPGDYGTRRRGIVLDLYGNGMLMKEGRREEWGGNEGFIQVGFDEAIAVLWMRFVPAGRRWTFIEQWVGRSLW